MGNNERHICISSDRIEKLERVWLGNGQEGLYKTIPKLSTQIESLAETIKAHSQKIDELTKFASKEEGIRLGSETTERKEKTNEQIKTGKVAILATMIVFVANKIIEFLQAL